MEELKSINTSKINKITFIIFTAIIFIVLILCPEIKKTGYSTLKTMMFSLSVVIAALVFAFTRTVEELKEEGKKISLSIYDILLIGYAILILISSIVSEYSFTKILWGSAARGEGLITMYGYFVTFVIFEKNFKYSERFFEYIIAAVVIVSAWGVVQTIIPEYINFSFINKDIILTKMAVGNMGNPNFFSSFLLIFLPICMVKYLEKKDIAYLFATSIIFAAFVCARTLGGYITFIVVFVILAVIMYRYFLNKKEFIKRFLILTFALILSFIAVSLINGTSYFNELLSSKQNIEQLKEGSDDFGSKRGLAWKIAVAVIKDYPLFGTGLETFGLKTITNDRYYYDEYKGQGFYFDKAHCEYLQIAAVTGIPALVVYLTFLTILGINLIKKYKGIIKSKKQDTESLICIMAGLSIFSYLFQAGANISITHIAPMFWAIMGIAANLCTENKKQNIDK